MREPKSNSEVKKGVKSIPPFLCALGLVALGALGLVEALALGALGLVALALGVLTRLPGELDLLRPPPVSISDFLFYNKKHKIIFICKHKKL
jgi:hypothetical protein